MPEVQVERSSFLEVAFWFDEEKQVTFPVFGDFAVTRVCVEFCLKSLEPFFTGEYCSHTGLLKIYPVDFTIPDSGQFQKGSDVLRFRWQVIRMIIFFNS